MSRRHIVIVTEAVDPHADDLIRTLHAMGHPPIRLNTDDIPQQARMGFHLADTRIGGSVTLAAQDVVVDVADIRSVWWRRPGPFQLPDALSEQERTFARDEIGHALGGLWAALDCYWVSHPEAIRQAGWKLEQLKRAAGLGFAVPRTLITNDPSEVRAFYADCGGQIIFKVMTDPFLAARKVASQRSQPLPSVRGTYTTLITPAHLEQLDSIRLVPCLFQEYIPKQYELRVTVIGDEVFAAAIYSQAHEKTRVDWRHYDVAIPYRKARLPVDIAERCLALTRGYNLNFSTMDLIVTPDERYVFIENNPNGQFLFIEKMVPELPLSSALAACLVRGSNN